MFLAQATGLTGTIGRHLNKICLPLPVDLNWSSTAMSKLNFMERTPLIHLAGKVGIQKCENFPNLSFKVNVVGTGHLAQHYKRRSTGVFVFVSSGHVYKSSTIPVNESSEIEPRSTYAIHKYEAEKLLSEIFSDCPDRLCIIRVFSVLDLDTPIGSLGHRISQAIKLKKKTALPCSEDVRDFLSPSDIGNALSFMIQKGVVSGLFNLCSGNGTSVRNAVRRLVGDQAADKYFTFEQSNSVLPHLVGDPNKLRTHLPSIPLEWRHQRGLYTMDGIRFSD
jgi:nucleoside-diphosphate-sugar epimerase